KTLPQRQVERDVAKIKPAAMVQEEIRPVAEDVLEFRCKISPETEKELTRSRETLSKKLGRLATWEGTLAATNREFLDRHDPVRRAERIAKNKQLSSRRVEGRKIPADLSHLVHVRDKGECQHVRKGKKCSSRMFTEIHHIRPVALGGMSSLENLTTLCSFHHDMTHGFESKKYAKPKISEAFVGWPLFEASYTSPAPGTVRWRGTSSPMS
ncbi:MAG TPA: HNH endonuclease, partial [Pseudobdellovibrionaceae bacterium]|nr:HNH endonuclease [Pseudobdellovibrionaceae bacterium]